MTTIFFSCIDSEEIDPQESPFQPRDGQNIPLFGKPKEIGHFSIDARRKIHFDKSQMKYLIPLLKMRGLYLDLNVNFSTDVSHNYVAISKMYQTLYWLKHHKHVLKPRLTETSMNASNIDFVTGRGTLALISCTPYIKECFRNQWEVCASKYNGIIYFALIDSDTDIAENENASEQQQRFQSWGYKFEQYITTDHIDGDPDLSSTTHQLEEYCVILKSVLNKHNLLYKAEMDAVIPYRKIIDGNGDTSCYTEIKTSRIRTTAVGEYHFHKYKTILWWAQSFFAGISEVVCGNRTNHGIVKSIDVYRVSSFPEEAGGLWSPDVCLNFCDKFLTYLKRIVIEDDYNVVYKLSYKSGDIIYCSKLVNPENRYKIIPDWYVKAEEE
ncbi:decapping and exoribonuclease protein-like [Argiope bruennichi]|uniref:Decapping nuclease n=1 Tax=Argiope bruennichi TaxID=94029 RepID=A0A8T0FY42_ARGBR|nr:decapping and exoribonuclease protein-like [Argiope bruennichi]KAF8795961.1 Decapping and exoribonuclease protein like [Argiope bruennichi]